MFVRAALVASLIATPVAAQDCTDDAMIVFDGSGSMSEGGFNRLNTPRIVEARKAVRAAIPDIAQRRDLGLMIYGPGGSLCSGIVLKFPPVPDAADEIIEAVEALQPGGDTALTEAVRQAAEVLDYRNQPGSIVLVTDGRETCGGNPCQLAEELTADDHDLIIHVIGFNIRGNLRGWRGAGMSADCLADQTGGERVTADTLDDLIAAFERTLGCNLLF